jgi:hypothetical protein
MREAISMHSEAGLWELAVLMREAISMHSEAGLWELAVLEVSDPNTLYSSIAF